MPPLAPAAKTFARPWHDVELPLPCNALVRNEDLAAGVERDVGRHAGRQLRRRVPRDRARRRRRRIADVRRRRDEQTVDRSQRRVQRAVDVEVAGAVERETGRTGVANRGRSEVPAVQRRCRAGRLPGAYVSTASLPPLPSTRSRRTSPSRPPGRTSRRAGRASCLVDLSAVSTAVGLGVAAGVRRVDRDLVPRVRRTARRREAELVIEIADVQIAGGVDGDAASVKLRAQVERACWRGVARRFAVVLGDGRATAVVRAEVERVDRTDRRRRLLAVQLEARAARRCSARPRWPAR